ncbi:alpha/beta hydrolase [Labrenzia sp. OB1]|uniref:alpha/beta hydrolase n=1 Tax=Labrenzia sp. OB1 TaxID=1561204 RepID=UPI0009EEB6D5|nr:alpha/beta hydrolase [Labrenzia sp. OB1]
MMAAQVTDWDDAYANAAHIPGAADYPQRWTEEAGTFRKTWIEKDLGIVYGETDRQRLDIFHPEGKAKGLVVYVHGGYWLKFDRSSWSHFAKGCLARGWSVCLPGYDLVPDVAISDITRQIGLAVGKACERIVGPVRLTGHSAGGHLVTRLVCEDTPLSPKVLARIEKVVSISGVHDLRPLRNTSMNDAFRMTEEDAVAESPALKAPSGTCPVVAWVGGDERPEFIRQSRLLSEAWPNAIFHEEPGRHHFDVIDGLQVPDSNLTSTLLAS